MGMLLWGMAAFTVVTQAQISISSTDLIEGCDDALVDSGSSTGPYGANENEFVTICPTAPDTTIWIEWSVFDLDGASTITIHDGDNTFAPILAQGSGDQLQGMVQIASEANPTGCLTVVFTSGESSSGNFAAGINCGQPCAVPVPVVNSEIPAPYRVCPGEEVPFDGADSYATGDAEITTWYWDWNGDGAVDDSTDNGYAVHVYDEPGIHRMQMSLIDAIGCESVQLTNYLVYVSNDPLWTMDPLSLSACTGEQVDLSVSVEGQPFTLEPSVDFGGGLFIPDEPGQCFSSELTFTQFIPGQTILSAAEAIENFFINFEHSFMGDLTITFECPNGQSMMVHQQGGGGTFLGVPVDNDGDPDTPGVGFDYYWAPDATNGTWADNTQGTLPSGTYESVQTWGNLDGCPLNGVWQMEICDLWGSDNGFVFDWAIQFADSLYPAELSFTPTFGLECDSTFWTTPQQAQNNLLSGQWNCAEVGVTVETPGTQVYTAHAVNNFGCEYTQDVEVEYVAFSPFIESSADIFCGGEAVELEVIVSNGGSGDLSVSWNDSPFLSDTTGAVVYVSGMNQPEIFQATIGQTFDDYPGLLCSATADVLIGTCEITIPNVVSPYSTSGDNDDFRIPGIQSYEDVELTVLNRWGNVVFESDDFGVQPFWDCAADGATSGVYFYVLKVPVEEGPLVVTDINGVRQEYDGEGPFVFEGTFHIVD
ncbi:MAG: gliding motility-associated C-terminal domain-containing protein [Bacteroidota bacterium]|nr:gliding motility-associated C-terminal domain-containing protein [Bacteroidota bacterium]